MTNHLIVLFPYQNTKRCNFLTTYIIDKNCIKRTVYEPMKAWKIKIKDLTSNLQAQQGAC